MAVVLQADVAAAGEVLDGLAGELVRRAVAAQAGLVESSQLIVLTSSPLTFTDTIGPFAADLERVPLAGALGRVLRRRDQIVDRPEVVQPVDVAIVDLHFQRRC